MKRFRPILKIGLNLLGPAILIYLLATTDLPKLWQTLLTTNLWLVALSIVLVIPFLFLKGLRWQLILQAWQMPLPLGLATALYSIGIFLGVVTPGQAGDAVKAWYLRKYGYPLSAGLASVVVDRLFDLGIMGVLAASGLYFFWDVLPGGKLLNVLVIVVILCGVAFGLALAGSRRLRALVGRLLLPFLPASVRERLASTSGLHLTPAQLLVIALVSATGLTLTFVRVYLLFMALHVPLPIGPFVPLIAMTAIVSTASPGGVGGRDAVLVLGLAAILHQSTEAVLPLALSSSALVLVLNLMNVAIGFLVSLRYPISEATAHQV